MCSTLYLGYKGLGAAPHIYMYIAIFSPCIVPQHVYMYIYSISCIHVLCPLAEEETANGHVSGVPNARINMMDNPAYGDAPPRLPPAVPHRPPRLQRRAATLPLLNPETPSSAPPTLACLPPLPISLTPRCPQPRTDLRSPLNSQLSPDTNPYKHPRSWSPDGM